MSGGFDIKNIMETCVMSADRTFGLVKMIHLKLGDEYKKMEWEDFLEILEIRKMANKEEFSLAQVKKAVQIIKLLGTGIHAVHYLKGMPVVIETKDDWAVAIAPNVGVEE